MAEIVETQPNPVEQMWQIILTLAECDNPLDDSNLCILCGSGEHWRHKEECPWQRAQMMVKW